MHFVGVLRGQTLQAARRRGKYLWLPLDSGDALLAHLGMSGQLLVKSRREPPEEHLRVRISLGAAADEATGNSAPGQGPPDFVDELRFVDQRTFGGLLVSEAGASLPAEIAHLAPDPFEAEFDEDRWYRSLRRRRTGLKRAMLDQRLIAGIGNIYADEALWASGLHYARPTETMRRRESSALLEGVRAVMSSALTAGGTSFDSLYVNVNGQSGSFDGSLRVYGRAGQACHRCGTTIRREAFMNRSSYRCPRCQPQPRRARW